MTAERPNPEELILVTGPPMPPAAEIHQLAAADDGTLYRLHYHLERIEEADP